MPPDHPMAHTTPKLPNRLLNRLVRFGKTASRTPSICPQDENTPKQHLFDARTKITGTAVLWVTIAKKYAVAARQVAARRQALAVRGARRRLRIASIAGGCAVWKMSLQ